MVDDENTSWFQNPEHLFQQFAQVGVAGESVAWFSFFSDVTRQCSIFEMVWVQMVGYFDQCDDFIWVIFERKGWKDMLFQFFHFLAELANLKMKIWTLEKVRDLETFLTSKLDQDSTKMMFTQMIMFKMWRRENERAKKLAG